MTSKQTQVQSALALRLAGGSTQVEWMYPGFLAIHFDGGYVACGDGDAQGHGWTFDVMSHDGVCEASCDLALPQDAPVWQIAQRLADLYLAHVAVKSLEGDTYLAALQAAFSPAPEAAATVLPPLKKYEFDYLAPGALIGVVFEVNAVDHEHAIEQVQNILTTAVIDIEVSGYPGALYLYKSAADEIGKHIQEV